VIGDVKGGALVSSTTSSITLNHGINITAASVVLNITGSVVGGGQTQTSGFNAGIYCTTNLCTINITGSVIGGAFANLVMKAGIYVTGLNCTINITGTVNGNVGMAVATTQITTNVYISGTFGTVGSAFPFSITRLVMLNGVIFCDVINSLAGVTKWMIPPFSDVEIVTETEVIGVANSLYTAGLLTGYPLVANVETGTVYGPVGEFEGTLSPVNIDTAQLAEDLLTELSTSSNALAERLRNVSTVQTTGSQLTALTIS
jgi:hypothetical protein